MCAFQMNQCVWLHLTGVCLFVRVVGPGVDSTSPAFVWSRASQAAECDGRLAKKTESGHISGGRDYVDTICADVCNIITSCRLCLLGTAPSVMVIKIDRYKIKKNMGDSINGSDYGILNWDTHMRVPPNAEPSSSDVSLASTSLITSCSWQTLSTLISDHLPILIRLQMKTTTFPGLRQTYVNLKKANWDRYR